MRKILLISYEYPPVGGAGVMKTLSLVRYIPEFGYQPYVISCANPRFDSPVTDEPQPENAKVMRSRDMLRLDYFIEAGKRMKGGSKGTLLTDLGGVRNTLLIDPQIGWFPSALRLARSVILKEGIDVVYSTVAGPLITSALVAIRLKRQFGDDLKFVIGMEDFWALRDNVPYLTPLHRFADLFFEREACLSADLITVGSETQRVTYATRYPSISEKFLTSYNGIETSEIPQAVPQIQEKFTITHAGTLDPSRSMAPLINAVYSLIESGQINRSKLQLVQRGRTHASEVDDIKERDVLGIVSILPPAPQSVAFQEIWASHVLYLMLPPESIGLTDRMYPYVASGNPTLALIPENECASFFRRYTNNVRIVKKEIDMQNAIKELYGLWEKKRLVREDRTQFIADFSKKSIVKVFVEKLNSI